MFQLQDTVETTTGIAPDELLGGLQTFFSYIFGCDTFYNRLCIITFSVLIQKSETGTKE